MAIKIVTDSAADIMPAEAEKMGVRVVPLTLNWDGVEYRDAIDMDHAKFFDRLANSETLPTTSQVSPQEFGEVFEEITENGDTVIAITLSSVLSGTCQSANLAAQDFEGKVFVVDSLSATVGQRLLIEEALSYVKMGMAEQEIVKQLEIDRYKVRILAKIDTLEYLKKGGRISPAVAFAGGLLSIKPVITVEQGAIEVIGKARGSKNGNNLLRKFVAEAGGIDFRRPYSLVYSGLGDDMLQQYIKDSADLWAGETNRLPIVSLGAVIGTHIGPGAIGLAFFEK